MLPKRTSLVLLHYLTSSLDPSLQHPTLSQTSLDFLKTDVKPERAPALYVTPSHIKLPLVD